MYKYIKAVLREKGLNTVWQQVDISDLLVMDIFTRFISGHIELTHPTLDGILYVDYEALKASSLPIRNVTFVQWLNLIGDQTIPATNDEPIYEKHDISFADAWVVGFRPQKLHPQLGLNYTLFDDQNTDLYMSRPGIQKELIHDYSIFTVNGYIHLPLPYKEGMRLVSGMRTINSMNKNRLGVISFENVGKLKHYKIEPNSISRARVEFNLSDSVYVHMHRDLTNKSVMLTTLGYLNPGAEVLDIINAEIGLVKINIRRLNLLNRVLESQNHLDYDIGLTTYENMPGAVSRDELFSDRVIQNILTCDYTFITVIDAPVTYFEHRPVSNVPLFGFYELSTFPKYPLVDNIGRIMEFVSVKKGDYFMIRAEESYQKHYKYETSTISVQDVVNNVVDVDGYYKQLGHQLIIGSMTRTTKSTA